MVWICPEEKSCSNFGKCCDKCKDNRIDYNAPVLDSSCCDCIDYNTPALYWPCCDCSNHNRCTLKEKSKNPPKHRYRIQGEWIYNAEIEDDKPRSEMLYTYTNVLYKNKNNAVFVKGTCVEMKDCHACDKSVDINDSYCKHCGAKL